MRSSPCALDAVERSVFWWQSFAETVGAWQQWEKARTPLVNHRGQPMSRECPQPVPARVPVLAE
jgi:hypothetical protein